MSKPWRVRGARGLKGVPRHRGHEGVLKRTSRDHEGRNAPSSRVICALVTLTLGATVGCGGSGADHAAGRTAIDARAVTEFNAGNRLVSRGRVRRGMTRLERALEIDPNFWEAHHNLGVLERRAGEDAAAVAHFVAARRGTRSCHLSHASPGGDSLPTGRSGRGRGTAAGSCARRARGFARTCLAGDSPTSAGQSQRGARAGPRGLDPRPGQHRGLVGSGPGLPRGTGARRRRVGLPEGARPCRGRAAKMALARTGRRCATNWVCWRWRKGTRKLLSFRSKRRFGPMPHSPRRA